MSGIEGDSRKQAHLACRSSWGCAPEVVIKGMLQRARKLLIERGKERPLYQVMWVQNLDHLRDRRTRQFVRLTSRQMRPSLPPASGLLPQRSLGCVGGQLYANVAWTAFIAAAIEDVDVGVLVSTIFGCTLAAIPGMHLLVDAVLGIVRLRLRELLRAGAGPHQPFLHSHSYDETADVAFATPLVGRCTFNLFLRLRYPSMQNRTIRSTLGNPSATSFGS